MEQNTIEKQIELLNKRIEFLFQQLKTKSEPTTSEKIDELATALAKAQGEYPPIVPNRENRGTYSVYADLDAILSPIRPILQKNNLSILYRRRKDPITREPLLYTRLLHSSGQWIDSVATLIPVESKKMNPQQSIGAALSYERRYETLNLLGLTICNDPLDDDGQSLTQPR